MAPNKIAADAVIHDRVVVSNDVDVYDGTVLVKVPGLLLVHYVISDPPITKAPGGDPAIIIGAVSEAETEPYIAAPVTKTNTGTDITPRRQRRPTAVRTVGAPRHPARAPGIIRVPHPTHGRRAVPPAIMERRPTPRIIRMPVPAHIAG